MLVVLVPHGVHGYSTGTAQAVLDYAEPGARLVFSCGWHITRDGQDVYSWRLKALVKVFGRLARLAEAGAVRVGDLDHPAPFRYRRRREAPDEEFAAAVASAPEPVYVYFRHDEEPAAPTHATRLQELLDS